MNMRFMVVPALALSLSGCASGGFGSSDSIKKVQELAASICKFVPTAKTVADIFLSGNGAMQTALVAATAICNAVTINPLADGPGAKNYKPTVNGVRVRGQFIK